jgi:hypothetical protein
MPTFPSFITSFDDPALGRPRALKLGDCKPGDLVFVMLDRNPELHLVTKPGLNFYGTPTIELSPDGLRYGQFFNETHVAKVDNSAVFVLDHDRRRTATPDLKAGAIRVSASGTSLVASNGTSMDCLAVSLDTFCFSQAGRGVEFTKWSIEVRAADGRRATLLEYSVAD